MEDNRYPK